MVDKKKESNGDHLSATGHLDKLDWLCCGTVFAFSLFSALLLSLAYPEGLTNPQTTMFFDVQSRFQILGHNSLDWICLYPYGGVLALGSAAGNPAWASYWLNNLLFSLNSALVFLLLRALFSARLLSFSMALMAVLIEFVSMRMFFYHLILSADALFGET